MGTGNSSFLENQQEILRAMVKRLSQEFAYVSVLGTDGSGKKFIVKKTGVSIEESFVAERGFVVRVYNGCNYSEHSFNLLNPSNFEHVVQDILDTARERIKLFRDANIKMISYSVIEEEILQQEFVAKSNMEIEEVSDQVKLERLKELMNKVLAMSDEIVDARVSYEEAKVSKVFISSKRDLLQSYTWSTATLLPIASRNGKVKYSFGSRSGMDGIGVLKELEKMAENAANDAIRFLDAKRIIPGEYEFVCDPRVAGLIAHEAFGHGVEMDMFVKNRAKAKEYMNEKVAASIVNMKDGAASAKEVASYFFDDEGNLGSDTDVIVGGILKSGFSDALSALQLGTKPTGNGRRESFERKTYARMTNTFFTAGSNTVEEMISSIKHGFFLDGFMSGMEDPKNWGIQCVILKTVEIIDGKLTDNVYSPVYLTGYVPDLLNSISMLSDQIALSGSGFCGKGYKEHVKTSTGGTYMKAVGRLS